MSEKTNAFFSNHWKTLLMALSLAGLTLWLFWPATGYHLLNFDDDRYVTSNLMVMRGLSLEGIRWAFKFIYESYWLPIVWISYMLDSTIFGPVPFGYHFTNILLHSINVALLFVFLKTWTRRFWLAAFVAALFAWHPLRAESVAWVTERKDVLSGLFLLLCLFAYGKFARKPVTGREVLAALFMALGLMTKPILVTIPFLLLLLDIWPFGRWDDAAKPGAPSVLATGWKIVSEKVLFWALMLVFVFMTYYGQKIGSAIHGADAYPWIQRLAAIPVAYLFYLEKTVLPTRLSIVYGDLHLSPLRVSAAIFILLAITALAFWSGRRSRAVPVGWIWFGLLLGPVIGIVRVGAAHVADRFTYLPSIGLGICATWFIADILPQKKWSRPLFSALAVVLLAACAWQTRRVLPNWKNSATAFGNAVQYLPDNALVNNNYGEALLSAGREEESLKYFEKAASIDKSTQPFRANVALALSFLGRPQEAIAMMESAMHGEDRANPFYNFSLGFAWVAAGQPDRGIPFIEHARSSAMSRPTWEMELAGAYLQANRMDAATNQFSRIARAGWPNFASFDGMCMFYVALWNEGHSRYAWTFFNRMIELHPDNISLLNNTAWLLATKPPPGVAPTEALRLAERARTLSANAIPANIMDTLAVAYAANGDFTNALHWVNKAYDIAVASNAKNFAANLDKRRRAFQAGQPWTSIIAPK